MKVAIYPGSFNPLHDGHLNVLKETLKVFDVVYVAIGVNPEKKDNGKESDVTAVLLDAAGQDKIYPGHPIKFGSKEVIITEYKGLLKDHILDLNQTEQYPINAIIKGIRDPQDFLYEQKMQYHNEDLGIKIPTFYVISDRKLVHVSSSAMRMLEKFKK